MAAFNQPLSLETSSVTTMGYMFEVRSARALPAASTVRWVLPAHGLRRCCPTRSPATRGPACVRPSSHASESTRQGAAVFNQPLSLDTSSVTNMHGIFTVRSARALPVATFTLGFSLYAA